MAKVILFNKPYQVLSQFTDNNGRATLAAFIDIHDVYPAGRLDYDSEGLLVLTDDGRLQHQIADPRHKLPKTYLVQLEGTIDSAGLEKLRRGVTLKDGLTKPAQAELIPAPEIWDRTPPIRERREVPTSWLRLTIREGKNRQVRRMTASVGFPTLRLIRWQVGSWTLDGIKPGEFKQITVHSPAPNSLHSRKNKAISKGTQ